MTTSQNIHPDRINRNDESVDARWWDSERRDSPFSTVADPDDESWCEGCNSDVIFSGPEDRHGTCNCDDL